jgi:hypothetical protein
MPNINSRGIGSIVAALPNWSYDDNSVRTADVFVAAVGFEDRMPILLERWCLGAESKRLCILIRYATNISDNSVNWEKCRRILELAQIKMAEVQYDQRTLAVKIGERLGEAGCETGVCVDISAMASFVFFPVFHSLLTVLANRRLWVGYVEAEDYFPAKADWDSYEKSIEAKDLAERADFFETNNFQSKGAEAIYECVYFVGRNPDQLPVKLILVPSFSFSRIFYMRGYAERSYAISYSDTEWVIGRPPNQEKNGWRAEAVYALCKPKRCSYCCTLEYKDILHRLHALWEESYLEKAMCIATMGSKAQHVGTLIFLLMHPEVSLLLSEPKEFIAKRFSVGFGTPRFLDFGKVADLKKLIREWNWLDFEWDEPREAL